MAIFDWFNKPASNTMLQNTFGNTFFKNQVAPVQSGATNVRPTNLAALKNWRPWKAFMPQSMGGTFHTKPTAGASRFIGSNVAYGLPMAYAYGAGKLQKSLPQSLQGEGGIYDQNPYYGAMGVAVDPEVEKTLRYGDGITETNYPGANRPLNTLDPNWQHQIRMQEIDRGNIDNKGFNFPSIFGTVKGGLEWLGDKFKRPDAKQRAYESIMGDRKGLGTWETAAGDYGGNRFALTNTPSGLKVGSDIIGYGQGFAKNFDSMFGSQSLEEMEQKKIDWALNRLQNKKAISTRLRNALMQRGLLRGDTPGNVTVDTVDFVDKVGPTVGGDAGPVTTGGGGTFNPAMDPKGRRDTTPSWGGATAAREAAGQQVAGPGFGRGAYWAKGGRVGLRLGGDPEEPAENIFEFMQDQGVPFGDMASAPHPDEAWYGLWENLNEKGIVPIEIETLNDFKNWFHNQDMDMGQINEEGIASIV